MGHHGVGQREGLRGVGGPPRDGPIDGSLVPCAAGGSLMFGQSCACRHCSTCIRGSEHECGGCYGFPDAFHPLNGWTNPDVVGIDLGITLVSAENARTGKVWAWFMQNPEIRTAFRVAGLA